MASNTFEPRKCSNQEIWWFDCRTLRRSAPERKPVISSGSAHSVLIPPPLTPTSTLPQPLGPLFCGEARHGSAGVIKKKKKRNSELVLMRSKAVIRRGASLTQRHSSWPSACRDAALRQLLGDFHPRVCFTLKRHMCSLFGGARLAWAHNQPDENGSLRQQSGAKLCSGPVFRLKQKDRNDGKHAIRSKTFIKETVDLGGKICPSASWSDGNPLLSSCEMLELKVLHWVRKSRKQERELTSWVCCCDRWIFKCVFQDIT